MGEILSGTVGVSIGDFQNGSESFDTNISEISNSSQLPIDMQFNDGHKLSIVVYTLLLLVSAVGNICVVLQAIR